ncbi:MAG: O-antigen ligase family protein [Planctomycetales bacterium]|nr:O-antigen ligase family protein [Planctomycetales bacterium]
MFTTIALFIISAACFPAEFVALDAGGLTWTMERLWLLVLVIQLALSWHQGRLIPMRFELSDVAIILFLAWLFVRTVTQPLGSVVPEQPATLMHFVNGYLIPIGLYFVLRHSRLDKEDLKPVYWLWMALGLYLGATAILEIAKVWSLVFPSFIADPTLGIHFGRARGPMLQSVRLGMCLLSCITPLLVFSVWLKPNDRLRWVGVGVMLPLLWAAVFFTYTRSIWMGLIAVTGMLIVFCLQGTPRRAIIFLMVTAVAVGGAIKGPSLIAFKREYSEAETRESTYMRAAMLYVSLEMFKDRPLAGYGFNQFQVYNGPYLAYRSTNIRLESIRGYVHHNSFLSLLVDLGLVGFALYMFVLGSLCVQSWAVWRANVPQWVRGLSLSALAICAVHTIQMAFHEVSFSAIENSMLYAAFGLSIAAKQQFCFRAQRAGTQTSVSDIGRHASFAR